MKTKKQKQTTEQNLSEQEIASNKLKLLLSQYIDLTVRSLISFTIMTIIALLVRNYIPYYYLLPAVFILSILLTPLYNRIKVAHLFIDKYMLLLNNIVYKLQQRKKSTQ